MIGVFIGTYVFQRSQASPPAVKEAQARPDLIDDDDLAPVGSR